MAAHANVCGMNKNVLRAGRVELAACVVLAVSVVVSLFGADALAETTVPSGFDDYTFWCSSPCPRKKLTCASNKEACCCKSLSSSLWKCGCHSPSHCLTPPSGTTCQ